MRLTILFLILTFAVPVQSADDVATLRARAALAIAFAEPPQQPPTYAEQYANALKDGKPLVVWVGQPARSLPGCVSVTAEQFPGADAVAVVVGVPAGGALRRVDVPGRPTDATVRAALRAVDGESPHTTALLPASR